MLIIYTLQLVKLARNLLGGNIFSQIMKMTVYGQFVAGENIANIIPLIRKYRKNGVRAILDYAVEEDIPDVKEEVVLETRYGSHASMLMTYYVLRV